MTQPWFTTTKTSSSVLGWLHKNLFSTWYNTLITLVLLWVLLTLIPPLFHWLVTNSVIGEVTPSVCRQADGACWAFVHEKWRFILFGVYPYEEQWRPAFVILLLILLLFISCDRRFWHLLPFLLITGLAVVGVLMWGGLFGLPFVDSKNWGGLPLTLLLSVIGISVSFPLAILLALGRRSRLPLFRVLCTVYIEVIRGIPIITLLFMGSLMLPLFLPEGVTINNLLRAQIAMILFSAAYLAENIRGGLQAIPKGQYEAAASLGLSYWQKMRLIILPQALVIVIPPMVNSFISFFKDTSLVVIIGIYDLMLTTKVALDDASWRGFHREAYLFIAAIYFFFTFFMSKYSRWLEKHLKIERY